MSDASDPTAPERRGTGLPPAVGPEPVLQESVLDERLTALEQARAWSPRVVSRLEALLRHPDDYLVFRINPIQFARERSIAEQEGIDLFLHATKLGLVNMFWHLVCPSCGDTVESLRHLETMHAEYRCDFCVKSFVVDFDDYIQVSFTVSPNIRDVIWNHPERLSAEDYALRYRFSQDGRLSDGKRFVDMIKQQLRLLTRLAPGESATAAFITSPGALLINNMLRPGPVLVRVEGEPADASQSVSVRFGERAEGDRTAVGPGRVEIAVTNNTAVDTVAFVTWLGPEDMDIPIALKFPDMLSGRRLLASQTFRDLFRSEVFQGTEGINVRDTNILFTDLKGSTALYEHIGDLNAYSLVRQHFDRLGKVINEHEGAVVKTIGDAVMASFSRPLGAVNAAVEMLRAIAAFNKERGSRDLILKIGVHRGASIAVNLNDRLDYFGQTVNIAARIQGLADADEIYLSTVVFESPGVAAALRNHQVDSQRAMLKGIADELTVHRVRLPELASDDVRHEPSGAASTSASPSPRIPTTGRGRTIAAAALAAVLGVGVGALGASGLGVGSSASPSEETSDAAALPNNAVPDNAVPGDAAPSTTNNADTPTHAAAALAKPEAAVDDATPEIVEPPIPTAVPSKPLSTAERKRLRRLLLSSVQRNAFTDAVRAGETMRAAGSIDWEASFYLARAHHGAGHLPEAAAAYDAFIAAHPKTKFADDATFYVGEILEKQGDAAGARARFESVANDPASNLRAQARAKLR